MGYRLLYNLLIHLGLPLALLALYKPKKGKPGFGARWAEHLGRTPASGQEAPLWIHAVSVGETLAISPFIRALKAERPDLPILLTTTTRTGAEQAARLGDLVVHRYAPLDYPWAVAAFLKRIKPRALWVMETELWPNWLAACEARHLPVTIINARLSERSCQRYARFQGAFDTLSRPLTHLLCQHQDDAERFVRLGIGRERLAVTGSIKFDIQLGDEVQAWGQALRQQLGQSRPVWIAASTHQGEDEQVLAAFDLVLQRHPQALLILVPRHPERFVRVAELCAPYGCVRRTGGAPIRETDKVYLGDTMGELPLMLAAADVAFVGGSLVKVGGHNLLEPAALGKPCLTGPAYFNFSDITRQLVAQGGAALVVDAAALGEKVSELLADEGERRQMGEQARAVVLRNQGALARTLSHCLASLESD
ncbi:3-deoxy-D-manno-octulosonic acid transferase [Aeromonas salmonicida]|uniref:3-deoxy-D-manno-octulosonic acid transferase n=1 Tax=Aeromonas salmonicida subsp. pectinolytica 34mel TaxID=1324960 RepID=T0P7D3_AERSA|nr:MULTISPECIES: lipid IV(A) 3-deoxy-D-manno-octulosonic acid transferase [Aeromonas]ATP07350.1 3-deoxy-D-manno-octulosonate transferase [Aeromonas salmonicida subsp. pectinolytica 34mel]EQC02905.1 3-deoxy-D-manno-octulosonic-acid transferase [Aeromonas salmonicida subsp. pectinolytica 34mel]TNI10277.1 3-deoxy-D-manno-octulosonic acid transferase [Aeromonas salmonicida]UUI60945.1 lipid IV(A) 3-deoxy-D-manno-octulosonic acid transferase [Aeromonas salmonicida]HEH9414938.1 lipid IV(A) 3-deoxy-D-